VNHTYPSAGIFTVTLVVYDGELYSTPYTTQATIGGLTDGQRDDVDAFLTYASPTERKVELPRGTASIDVVILYGPTIDLTTFEARLEGRRIHTFHPVPGTCETVTIPLDRGRNTLALEVQGRRTDGKRATDKDKFVFIVHR
jgi:hypothetical protein